MDANDKGLNRPLSRRAVLQAGTLGAAATTGASWGRAAPSEAQAEEGGMLTDVPGFLVGHATLEEPITGCTVILCPPHTTGGVEIRGGWTGTRDMDVLSPLSTSPHVHGLLFTGGSAYGLAAADGVLRWLEEKMTDPVAALPPVPQVPGAVIYDLAVGAPSPRPGPNEGYAACQAAAQTFARGSVGAGTGARVGPPIPGTTRMKGGVGSASLRFGADGVVAALAVVNALGNVLDRDGKLIAGAHGRQGQHVDAATYVRTHPVAVNRSRRTANTTLVAVATNAALTKTQCAMVARMAQAGLARAVHPTFTSGDGDVVVVLASGAETASEDTIGILAAEVVADAIRDGVRQATSRGGVPDMRTPGVRSPDDPAWSTE